MIIDCNRLELSFREAVKGKVSSQDPAVRSRPPLWRYDYLSLESLSRDVGALIAQASRLTSGGLCLDVGSNTGPYTARLREAGYQVESMDIEPGTSTYVGFIEDIPIEKEKYDAVLCTQVLEHSNKPWRGVTEISRILKPGGVAILSAPHVWFFHPHPTDHWRFTQQGMATLCAEAGLEVLELRGQLGAVANLVQIVNFLAYGVLGKIGGPLYAVNNVLGIIADKIVPNELFCGNFAVLARKR
jgi:2-polyprenyl-3-methyl-5-hydroxy-6-metoxy-1,4-benzoquinol methylase